MKIKKGNKVYGSLAKSRILSVSFKVKNSKKSLSSPLVSFRWGDKRTPSYIVRVSFESRKMLDQIIDKDRRRWLDQVIKFAFDQQLFSPLFKLAKK